MKRTTFYVLATVCGLGSVLFALVVWLVFCDTDSGAPKPFRVQQDFWSIGNALKTYLINGGRPPTTAQGLDALIKKPTQGPTPRRWVQVMKKLFPDPWQTPYRYTLLSSKAHEWRWELRSAGADRTFGTGDDLMEEFETSHEL